jgi:hypothetical protein
MNILQNECSTHRASNACVISSSIGVGNHMAASSKAHPITRWAPGSAHSMQQPVLANHGRGSSVVKVHDGFGRVLRPFRDAGASRRQRRHSPVMGAACSLYKPQLLQREHLEQPAPGRQDLAGCGAHRLDLVTFGLQWVWQKQIGPGDAVMRPQLFIRRLCDARKPAQKTTGGEVLSLVHASPTCTEPAHAATHPPA